MFYTHITAYKESVHPTTECQVPDFSLFFLPSLLPIIGCRCFPHGGSHQRVNLCACSLSQMVMQEDTEIYPGSGKKRPYVQRGGERVCIILYLSACTGANTSVVWSVEFYCE